MLTLVERILASAADLAILVLAVCVVLSEMRTARNRRDY